MTVGHNSAPGGVLVGYLDRIENIDDEIDGLKDDRKEVFSEAKAAGIDVKVLRKVIARRRRDKNELAEEDNMIAAYEDAVNAIKKDLLGN
jgi:uncharacterized protein (UPF0335 family)